MSHFGKTPADFRLPRHRCDRRVKASRKRIAKRRHLKARQPIAERVRGFCFTAAKLQKDFCVTKFLQLKQAKVLNNFDFNLKC